MENDKRYTLIGGVIVAAIFIFVVLLTSLGGHGFLTQKIAYKIYFDKSVKGLNINAPVMFRGIRIGSVENIKLIEMSEEMEIKDKSSCPVEVTVVIEPDKLDLRYDDHGDEPSFIEKNLMKPMLVETWMTNMVTKNGMAATLQVMSLLTGQQYVALDISREPNNDPAELVNLQKHIIPSKNTAADDIYMIFQKHNITEMVNKATAIVNDFIVSGKAQALLDNVVNVSDNAKTITADAKNLMSKVSNNGNNDLGAAMLKLNAALDEATALLGEFKKDSAMLTDKLGTALNDVPDLQERLKKSMASIDKLVANLDGIFSKGGEVPRLLDNANGFVNNASGTLAPEAPTMLKLNAALEELEGTLRSLRQLADMVNRRPEVLIRGK